MKLAVFVLLLVVLPFQASSYVCDNLEVFVMRAAVLEGDGALNPPDPYVKVTVDGKAKQTRVIHDVYEPRWYENLKFTNVKSDKMVVEIWEYDDFLRGGDDHVKTCKETLKLGSYALKCGGKDSDLLLYGVHCLKGNMKKQHIDIN